ncbi:MAG: DUF5822 domain-containing protein [Halobacteriales archaeon]
MPEPVEQHQPDGIDYGWIMQVTFITTIIIGVPVVAFGAAFVRLPSWGARAAFAVRVGAVVWFLSAIGVYLYARSHQQSESGSAE